MSIATVAHISLDFGVKEIVVRPLPTINFHTSDQIYIQGVNSINYQTQGDTGYSLPIIIAAVFQFSEGHVVLALAAPIISSGPGRNASAQIQVGAHVSFTPYPPQAPAEAVLCDICKSPHVNQDHPTAFYAGREYERKKWSDNVQRILRTCGDKL